ncbi:hypothetical protein [Clostridium sp.]|uniref:hypothetical protein n=1 Tax=Clostridium sp. TaxID=1506 RepID=UPI002FC7CD6E
MKFTNYDKAIMIGLTLGDGYIDPKGMLQITHCDRKKEYLTFKAKLLHSVVGGKNIKVINILKHSIYKKNGSIVSEKTLSYFRIRRQSTSFMLFRNLLYPENKKMITSNTLDLLAPISIAI